MSDALTVRRALGQAGLAPIDAQVLLAHVLKRDRAWLLAHPTDPLMLADVEAFARTSPAGASSGACRSPSIAPC